MDTRSGMHSGMHSIESPPVAFITGSGRRLGRQLAYAFADAGYDIILHAHASVDGMEEARQAIVAKGRSAFPVRGDLSLVADIQRMAKEAAATAGRIDVLVHNAGTFPEAAFDEVTEQMWDAAQNINTRSIFFLTQACAPALRASNGSVVVIASVGGMQAWRRHIPYNVSKAGTLMLTRALAKELAPAVRVNAVAPGIVLVPDDEERAHPSAERIPLQRYGVPADIAGAVLFLARAPYITGQVLAVDGGTTAAT
jgi:pteridine reductase